MQANFVVKLITSRLTGYDPEFGKGEEMFKDLALSNDLLADYHEKYPMDNSFSVMVLQESQWPYTAKQGSHVDLSPEVRQFHLFTALINKYDKILLSLDRYSAFYTTKHKQKKLNWIHELGTATLMARFDTGEKELSVSLYQGIVLLLFNSSTKLRFTEIKQLTNMGE